MKTVWIRFNLHRARLEYKMEVFPHPMWHRYDGDLQNLIETLQNNYPYKIVMLDYDAQE